MATIRKLPSGNYQAIVKLPDSPTVRQTFSTRKEAKAWAYEQENASPSLSVGYTIIHYLRFLSGKGGFWGIAHRSNHIDKHLGDHLWANMRKATVYQYEQARRKEGAKDGAIRDEIILISTLCRFANTNLGDDSATYDLLRGYKLPERYKPRHKVCTESQYKAILKEISPQVAPLVILAWETSMRRSEILSIKRHNIDWNSKTLLLDSTKNGHQREVPLNSRAMATLASLPPTAGELLFDMKPHSVTRAFKRACERLGFDGLCFHSLRHTAITRYAKRGLNTLQLQVISGHRDVTMLARYTHLSAKDVLDLIE